MATAKASTSAQSPDKMKQLMNSDPKFIGRLINGLDANMGKMLLQKKARLDEIAADQAEIDRIDAMIKSHVTPNMERLNENIRLRTDLRDHLVRQLAEQKSNLVDMQKDAAALVASIRSKTSKLMRTAASHKLEEARGFNASTPTTTLIKSGTTRLGSTTTSTTKP